MSTNLMRADWMLRGIVLIAIGIAFLSISPLLYTFKSGGHADWGIIAMFILLGLISFFSGLFMYNYARNH